MVEFKFRGLYLTAETVRRQEIQLKNFAPLCLCGKLFLVYFFSESKLYPVLIPFSVAGKLFIHSGMAAPFK